MFIGNKRECIALDSSNIKSNKREIRHIKAKIIKTTDQPNKGRIILATPSPMKEANAVPINRSEYTLDPSLYI